MVFGVLDTDADKQVSVTEWTKYMAIKKTEKGSKRFDVFLTFLEDGIARCKQSSGPGKGLGFDHISSLADPTAPAPSTPTVTLTLTVTLILTLTLTLTLDVQGPTCSGAVSGGQRLSTHAPTMTEGSPEAMDAATRSLLPDCCRSYAGAQAAACDRRGAAAPHKQLRAPGCRLQQGAEQPGSPNNRRHAVYLRHHRL